MSLSVRARVLLYSVVLLVASVPPAGVAADSPRTPAGEPKAPAEAAPPVYVILWFDTEDYLLPASDDAARRLADWLKAENVRATFKVVGEKARTLERRGRTDVIAALAKHEIGYHSNWHSVQPSPAMYLSALGWDEGVAEFDRRERAGVDDVTRIMGRAPSCYGQPGSSWAPQTYGAMRAWGMPVYLDAGNHVSLDDKPHYYGGLLNLYKLAHQLRAELDKPADLDAAQDRFLAARKALQAEGGGIVSIYYHPCEFVHRAFWDGVNFKDGANPARTAWKIPPQKTADESKVAFANFEGYVRFMKRFSDVRFITASEAATLYRDDARTRRFSADDLKAIAAAVTPEVSFQRHAGYAVSPAETFVLLNDALRGLAAGKFPDHLALAISPDGPSGPVPVRSEAVTTDWSQLVRTAADVQEYVRRHRRIPTAVWLGSTPVSPETYLAAVAPAVTELFAGKEPPATVRLTPATFAAAKYVADDGPKLWGWVIFPPGFRAPALMQLAKRQAWTIKPAVLHAP